MSKVMVDISMSLDGFIAGPNDRVEQPCMRSCTSGQLTKSRWKLYEWNFPGGGVLQLVQDEKRAGQSSITLMVTSCDDQIHKLKKKDIPIGTMTETAYVKTVTFNDPEGNRITFAERLD